MNNKKKRVKINGIEGDFHRLTVFQSTAAYGVHRACEPRIRLNFDDDISSSRLTRVESKSLVTTLMNWENIESLARGIF